MEKGSDKSVLNNEFKDFLNHAVSSLHEAEIKLEEAYKKRNPNQFNALKKFMLKVNKSMMESL